MMICHAYVSRKMSLSVLVPIPKNRRKSLYSSDNYRSIALSSIMGKVLDRIFLFKHAHVFSTSNLQFGFEKGNSTTQCSFVLERVIQYYNSRKSLCIVMLLDASRAFDRVQYVKLFELLLSRGLCPIVAKLL